MKAGILALRDKIRTDLISDRQRIKFCLLITWIIGMTAHGYAFFNQHFAHDSLNALYASYVEEKWKVALGRFVVPVYRYLTRGSLALPWLIGLLSIAFLSVTVYLVVRMFQVQSRSMITLIAGIMVTNLCVIAQTATYEYELDLNMLALLLAVVATLIWKKGRPIITLIVGGILVTLSLGIYQSYVSVTVAFIVFFSMLSLLEGDGWKKTVIKGCLGIGMLAVGVAVYLFVRGIACQLADVTLEWRVHFSSGMDAARVWELVIGTYRWFYETLYSEWCYPANMMTIINFALILSSLSILLYMMIRERVVKLLDGCLLLILIALIPFATNAIYFLTNGMVHDLMYYATWMVYVMECVLVGRFIARNGAPQWMKMILKTVCIVSVGVLIWQNILIANSAYLKKDLEDKSELSRMTRVIADMENHEDYVPGETRITFVGISRVGGLIPGFFHLNGITGLEFIAPITVTTSEWYFDVYHAYFEYILNYTAAWANASDHYRLEKDERVAAMPAYPNRGYIQLIDDILVIKME